MDGLLLEPVLDYLEFGQGACRNEELIADLRAEIARLREALAFYADRQNWKNDTTPYGETFVDVPQTANIDEDTGDRARAALEVPE